MNICEKTFEYGLNIDIDENPKHEIRTQVFVLFFSHDCDCGCFRGGHKSLLNVL